MYKANNIINPLQNQKVNSKFRFQFKHSSTPLHKRDARYIARYSIQINVKVEDLQIFVICFSGMILYFCSYIIGFIGLNYWSIKYEIVCNCNILQKTSVIN